jgi:hypothetical protein
VLDLHPDDRAGHDRRQLAVSPAAAAGQLRVQACPGGHLHPAVLIVVGLKNVIRGRPGGRVGAAESGAVPARPAQLAGSSGRRVGVEDPVGTDPHQHRHRYIGQVDGERDRVVAGVEDEQRHRHRGAEPFQQRPDLGGGDGPEVLAWGQPPHIQRRGP